MLRRGVALGVCMLVLVFGCKKKEQEPEKAVTPQGQVMAPAGFAHVPGTRPPAFISQKPVTVGEYLSYAQATGVRVPESLEKPPSAADSPVTALSLAEAERFAKWTMARLPTASEWKAATQIVGAKPYPWGQELGPSAARTEAHLYLIRDWTQGSLQEQAAKEAKVGLEHELLTERTRELTDLTKELETVVAESAAGVAEKWKAVKPALFGAIQKGKEHSGLSAERERRKDVLTMLEKVAREKLKVVNLKIAEDTTPEKLKEATEAYTQLLAEERKKVQEIQDDLVKKNQAASEKATELAQKLEGAGDGLADRLRAVAEAPSVVPPEKTTLEEAVGQRQRLRLALASAKASADKLGALLDALGNQAKARTGELEKALADLAAQDPNVAKIEDMQARIKALNENLGEEFVQEPHLFGDLGKLTEISARMKALEYEVNELKAAIQRFEQIELEGEKGAVPKAPAAAGTAG